MKFEKNARKQKIKEKFQMTCVHYQRETLNVLHR